MTTLTHKTRYIALFAIGYFICALIVTAPAYLLDSAAGYFSDQRLSLANCQGTIWRGSATPLLHTANHVNFALHTLQWRIDPQALLLGRLSIALNWEDLDTITPMRLQLDRQSVVLSPVQLPLPAAMISELSPYLKPAQFSGSLMLDSPRLTYAKGTLLGNATVHWREAGSAMSSVNPMGNYQIDVNAKKDQLSASLITQNGPLLLEGKGVWSPLENFHFYGTARTTNPSALNELLHHLGPESSPGLYQISI